MAPADRDVPRAAAPLVWLLALGYLMSRAAGRAAGRALWRYETALSALGGAGTRIAKAALTRLGPLGRLLRTALIPVLQGLRWLWRRAGASAFAALCRYAGWIGRVSTRYVAVATGWLGRSARPLLHRLGTWVQPIARRAQVAAAAVTRRAAGLAGSLRRAWGVLRTTATGRRPAR